MRIRPRGPQGIEEGDLTPMIDMTFQLIAFFMLVINFGTLRLSARFSIRFYQPLHKGKVKSTSSATT